MQIQTRSPVTITQTYFQSAVTVTQTYYQSAARITETRAPITLTTTLTQQASQSSQTVTRTTTLQLTATLPAATQSQTLTLPPFTIRETLAGSTAANTTITATAYVTGSNRCNDSLYTASNGRVFQPDCAVYGYANGAGAYVSAANGPQCTEMCTGNCAIANWQNGYCNLGSGTLFQSNWANSTYYTSYASFTAYVPVTSAINAGNGYSGQGTITPAVANTVRTISSSPSSLSTTIPIASAPPSCPWINCGAQGYSSTQNRISTSDSGVSLAQCQANCCNNSQCISLQSDGNYCILFNVLYGQARRNDLAASGGAYFYNKDGSCQ